MGSASNHTSQMAQTHVWQGRKVSMDARGCPLGLTRSGAVRFIGSAANYWLIINQLVNYSTLTPCLSSNLLIFPLAQCSGCLLPWSIERSGTYGIDGA